MKIVSSCDIINVNKSIGAITLPWGTPQDAFLYEDLKALFWCTALYCADNLRIVYPKHLLYHSDHIDRDFMVTAVKYTW